MKIVVNTRFLIKDKIEGIGRFTMEMLKCMVSNHPEHEFIFLFDRPFNKEFLFASNVRGIRLFPPARHPLLFIWYFEWSIYRFLKKEKPDLFLSCDGFLCLRTTIPQIAVIHDLAFLHFPHDIGFSARMYYHYFFRRFANKASRICTVSQFSKTDIILKFQIDPGKIDVVYNGASGGFKPMDETSKQKVRKKYTFDQEYFVYTGALQPRKNIIRLLRAFDLFKQSQLTQCKLVIVGRKAWKTKSIDKTFQSLSFRNDILFTGRIPDEELSEILCAALALVYVPYFEGFGIPILEAMQCGTPVITSSVTAMPEVAGEASLLVDPYDIDQIKTAMETIYLNESMRNDLSLKSLKQATHFSWIKTAELVWESILKTIP